MIRARFMIRPLEGGVSPQLQDQGQDQGGAPSAEETCVPRRSERLRGKQEKYAPLNDDVAKLREYRRLNRLDREQMAEEMRLEQETSNIRQNAGGFSLVNVQWASFATGASAIFVVAIIVVAVIICCWLRAKGQRPSKHLNSQLLSALTSAIVPGPPSSCSCSERPESSDVTAAEAAKWIPTPSGWAIPGASWPSPGVMSAQLPFSQFPPHD